MSYYITFDSSGGVSLAHGVEWRRHKYIRKEGNRYIYPEDLSKQRSKEAVNKYQQDGQKRTTTQKARDVASKYQHDGYRRTAMENARKKQYAIISSRYAQINGEKRTEEERTRQLQQKNAEVKQRIDHYRQVIEPAQRRGQQRTADTWRQSPENPYAIGIYNVSKNTPGAIENMHNKVFGTTEYWKHETGKEHQARLNAGAAQRAAGVKFKASINTATKAVAKWGSNTINSAKNLASKGASLVSNLFKKKK